ncbi:MAG: hypothetical protein E7652_08750, partial [Ruminococcaceae bacterium]|nr:hypothetical protein [Oscillospiraceae bacterium]
MKTNGFMRILTVVSLLVMCMLCVCSAAVSVDDVTSVVGPQVKLTAKVTDIEATSYQWYKCDDAQGTNPVAIDGATSAEYTTPYLDVAGTSYYMVKVNDSESAVAKVTATMPTEPVVFMFNNPDDLSYVSLSNASNKAFTTVNGNDVFSFVATSKDSRVFFGDLANCADFYVQGYPYIVVKSSNPDVAANTLDLYFSTDRHNETTTNWTVSNSYYSMSTSVGDGFHTTVVNALTKKYKNYVDGVAVKNGTAGSVGYDAWYGKLNNLRIDASNTTDDSNSQKTYYIEYLGFFPTEEMALAYAGAMPHDDDAQSIIDAVKSNDIEINYASSATAAAAYAEAAVRNAAEDAIQAIKDKGINNVVLTVSDDGEFTPSDFLTKGSYTFTLKIMVGDITYRRTITETELTVAIAEKEMPPVFVDDVFCEPGPSTTLKVYVNEGEATSYQWYKCDDAMGANPVAIEGATSETYTTDYLDKIGNYYYMVKINGTEASNVAVVNVKAPEEPVVFQFNNEEDIKSMTIGGTGASIETVDGKTALYYSPANDSMNYMPVDAVDDFYVQAYPYFAISASYPDYESNTIDLYVDTDRTADEDKVAGLSAAYAGISPVCGKGFSLTVLNTATGTYNTYVDGRIVSNGASFIDGIGSRENWKGKFTTLRIDFSNRNEGKPCYIEYIGFFPTEEMAVAYAGAMPEDDKAAVLTEALKKAEEDGKFSISFCDAENINAAEEKAAGMIEETVADVVEELKKEYETVEFSTANAKIERITPYGKGTYTADAQILIGDVPFQRSLVTTQVVVDLPAKPEPVVMSFDTEAKVKAAAVSNLTSKTFVAKGTVVEGNTEAEDRSFMRLYHTTGSDMNYTNFYEQTGKVYDFSEYPYLKMSYRRDIASDSGEKMMLYGPGNTPSFFIIPTVISDTEPYWEQLIVDMRTGATAGNITFYQEAAGTTTKGGLTYNGTGRTYWSDLVVGTDATPLEFRLTRYGTVERTIDYEYIGFFASLDEARMYPNALPADAEYDVKTLTEKNSFNAPAGVVTKAQAEKAADDYLSTFVFASKYNIDTQNAVFTAPSSAAEGTYVFDVWFGKEQKEEYTVTVTMTMAKLPKPAIMYMDNLDVMNSFSGSNAIKKLEDGVIKMSVNNPATADAFYLEGSLPGCMDSFNVAPLPYLKMRYKISGITEKTDGTAFDPAGAKVQVYFWMSDPSYPGLKDIATYRDFSPYAGVKDGDELEIIVDTSHITTNGNYVWVRNLTQGETEYRNIKFNGYRTESGGSSPDFVRTENTKLYKIRLNPSRNGDLDRYVEFAYAGFFASLDEAMNFDSTAATAQRLVEAEAKLRELADGDVVIPWAQVAKERTEIPDSEATLNDDGSFNVSGVKTQSVLSMLGLRKWVKDYIGLEGAVEINDYTAATTTQKGTVTFDISIESGYQSRTIENINVKFEKKPGDHIMIRFNDPEILSKIYAAPSPYIEDNLIKTTKTFPNDGVNPVLSFNVNDLGIDPFLVQNYSYILMKHKRQGEPASATFHFDTAEGNTGSTSQMGFGQYGEQWYYTLIDANIRDKVTPWVYNYNTERDVLEKNYVDPKLGIPTAPQFLGEAETYTLHFGHFRMGRSGYEIEFIAFFPSMADARNYVENLEKLDDAISDTAVELKNYTSDTVSYYDGNTETVAQAKAKAIIEDKISAPGVDVEVTAVSYTAPVLGSADGAYTFTATVTLDGEHVYTTDNITLTIGKDADNSPSVYKFANPKFIKTIDGASDKYDYTAMSLKNNYFVLETVSEMSNVVAEAYNTLKLDATFTGGFTAIINDNEEIVYEGDADGVIYLDLGDFVGNIDTFKVQFNNEGAKVRALGFFADNSAAQAYDFDAEPAVITSAKNAFSGTHFYTGIDNVKTLANAKVYTEKTYVPEKLGESEAKVIGYTYTNYVASEEKTRGAMDVTVKFGYGKEYATSYGDVTFNVTLDYDTDREVITPKSEGHEFLGYDTITATKNLASAAQTVEFNIKVSQKRLSGTMSIIKIGNVGVNITNGKIVAGPITSASTLKADTWTHVAITSDGKIYLDGVLDNTCSALNFNTSAPVIGDKFIGHLRDVRLWNDIRTAQEIAANKSTRTDSDGLLANWMLDAENYKWLEYFDSSANNNTAIFKSTGWYKMEAGLQGDYSIIHFGDTQSYLYKAPLSYNRIPEMFKWMAENKDKYNIGQVSLLGDATQTNQRFEWEVIREAFDHIEGVIPYNIPLGNHDYPTPSSGVGAEIRDTYIYREAFPYDDYVESFGPNGDNSFGGTFRDEKDLTNMYSLVTIGGVDYIFFSLEYGPRDAVLDWVGEVLTKYPERYAVISTHCYFETNGTLSVYNSTTNEDFSDGNEGIDLYEKLITKYPNIFLVTCGHSQGPDTKQHPHNRGSDYKDSPTADDFGNDVIQILADCSAYALNYPDDVTYDFGSTEANKVEFGADEGLIFIMMFEDNGRTMHTYIYSPVHDAFFRSVNEQTHTVKEIKTQPSLNVVGTELREATTEQSLGMRFKMTLSKSFANFEDEVEVLNYGVVVVPEDVMEEGMEVTADMLEGTENAKYVKVEECSDTIFYEDDEKIDFTVVIHSIPTNDDGTAYARQFKARAY